MKVECIPSPKIVLTFEYEELKRLRDAIERLIATSYVVGKSENPVHEFLIDIGRVL